jgi:hypothetical protein
MNTPTIAFRLTEQEKAIIENHRLVLQHSSSKPVNRTQALEDILKQYREKKLADRLYIQAKTLGEFFK